MSHKSFRLIWGLAFMVAASLACNLVSGIGQQVKGAQATAQGLATDIQSGKELFATGKAVATEVLGSGLAQTAQAFVTEQGPGLLATAQAFATDQGPGLLATAQAFATEQGPGLLETAQAFATEQGPGLAATIQALTTQAGNITTEAPADIPLVPGDKESLVTSSVFVTYFTTVDYAAVQTFYKDQMPANGWTEVKDQSFSNENVAEFHYQKEGRTAVVHITRNVGNSKTNVAISISGQ